MKIEKDYPNVVNFKEWLLMATYQMCVMNLPQDEDITFEIGDDLSYKKHETKEMPCAKCEAGFTNVNVTYKGKSVTAESGAIMEHLAYLDADDVTQALWATAWTKGYVKPLYSIIEGTAYEYNYLHDRYEKTEKEKE